VLAGLPAWAADPPPLELAQTIPLSAPASKRLDHLALDAKRDRLFVANMANASLDVIDLKAGKVLKSIPAQDEIQGIAYIPGVDRVVAALGSGSVNIFDGDSLKMAKTIKLPDADNVRVDGANNLVYVTRSEKKIAVFDAKSFDAKGEITLPSGTESFVLEKDRPRLYVNLPAPRQVAVVDRDKREVLKRYTLNEAGNYPLALDEKNHRLFVGTRKEPRLIVLDTESGKELSSVAIPGDIDDLFFDAKRKRLYASCGEGYLVVLKQAGEDRYEVEQKVATVKMARTCLFDEEGGRLFVPLPRAADKEGPEIRVYKVRP
jgi:DNA-binding beta-propeller fold protein YncE